MPYIENTVGLIYGEFFYNNNNNIPVYKKKTVIFLYVLLSNIF